MRFSAKTLGATSGAVFAVLLIAATGVAQADVNVLWPDPVGGWRYSYQDGAECCLPWPGMLDGAWWDTGHWDGSAIESPTPGGVSALTEDEEPTDPNNTLTEFIRIQDPGGSVLNDDIRFWHDGDKDGNKTKIPDWVNRYGFTMSFRTRLSTSADPNDPDDPLDPIHYDGDPNVTPLVPGYDPNNPGATTAGTYAWPTDGVGLPILNDKISMFAVGQELVPHPSVPNVRYNDLYNFSLIKKDELNYWDQVAGRDPSPSGGLIMNNLWDPSDPNQGPNTDEKGQLNIIEIPDAELTEWHEFWITIEADDPNDPNATHTVNVYMDGSVTPQTFVVRGSRRTQLGAEVMAIHMSPEWDPGWTAFDVDFFSYLLGLIPPEAGLSPGDVNGDGFVNDDDVMPFLDHLLNGEYVATADMNEDGLLNGLDVDSFVAAVNGAVAGSVVVPEPASMVLAALAALGAVGLLRVRRR